MAANVNVFSRHCAHQTWQPWGLQRSGLSTQMARCQQMTNKQTKNPPWLPLSIHVSQKKFCRKRVQAAILKKKKKKSSFVLMLEKIRLFLSGRSGVQERINVAVTSQKTCLSIWWNCFDVFTRLSNASSVATNREIYEAQHQQNQTKWQTREVIVCDLFEENASWLCQHLSAAHACPVWQDYIYFHPWIK